MLLHCISGACRLPPPRPYCEWRQMNTAVWHVTHLGVVTEALDRV